LGVGGSLGFHDGKMLADRWKMYSLHSWVAGPDYMKMVVPVYMKVGMPDYMKVWMPDYVRAGVLDYTEIDLEWNHLNY
jgi:hypothetical protein